MSNLTAPSLGIWLVRAEAEPLAGLLQQHLGGVCYRPWLTQVDGVEVSQKAQFAQYYRQHRQWLLLGATGIAVRFLEGLPKDKHVDPALVVVDEAGRFAISLLAGHEGGANQLAYRVAAAIGAVPVITTATEAIKPLVVGIGCRKGVSVKQISAAVVAALGQRSLAEVREIATVDLKANEPGLLAFCQQHGLPLRVFSHATVAARAWVSQASAWVQQNVGLDGVCEPCALIAAPRGALIVPKTALNGIAVAIVEDQLIEVPNQQE
ncbi:cobalamin biosynthesis protein [Glaciimonas sp. PCH181]|uniref:cobalamin biosynthesis protein n=1 Tax=Glaciimonas sp. PCH181 TaxID=2133943 RepID=UPI000D352133|nr:cobalamin biosynthesis protein [Glaciimonas sp. PCH181]PUA18013.1 cobalamin biosynthesis protein CbiG [Glaciimonas sp. PCH181]